MAAKAMRVGRSRLSRDERLAYLLLLPALGAVFVIVTIPFVLVVIQSISADDGTLLGLSFALLVHRTVRRTGLRAAIYVLAILPLVVPPVAIGVVARLVYAPSYGVLNVILERVGLTHHEVNWLGDPTLAMLAVASVDIWQWTPFVYLVLFSGLQTVPRESVEAAQIDGADWWAQFRYIDLFYLRPLFLLIIFFRLADVLRVFDHVFILTGGGPGTTTQLLSLYMYRVEFKFFDTGQAAALAVLVLVSFSILYRFISRALPLEPR